MKNPATITATRRSFIICAAALSAQCVAASDNEDTRQWLQGILAAWETTCRGDLRIPAEPLSWLIVYDEIRAWHVNPEQRLLPAHKRTSVNLRFSGHEYGIFEVENRGRLWVPGRDPMPIKPQAAAMVYANDTKPFFIAASLAFQQRAQHVSASNDDFRNFFKGLILHELTHTRQLPQVMRDIKQLQAKHRYPANLDDNFIETEFGSNLRFREMVEEEERHFSKAILASDAGIARTTASEGLRLLQQRRKEFLIGRYEGWSEMEDIFLALEGSAMWVQFQSALKSAPAGQSWVDTLRALSQRTDAWSQSEGLGLFLLLDRFRPGWQPQFFGAAIPSPTALLRRTVSG